jgi:hypothetical protein
MFALCRSQNYVLVTILWMCTPSVLVNVVMNLSSAPQLTHKYLCTVENEQLPTCTHKKDRLENVLCTCVRAFTRSSQVRHKSKYCFKGVIWFRIELFCIRNRCFIIPKIYYANIMSGCDFHCSFPYTSKT